MWNPEQYNKYSEQRNRPAIELIERIPPKSYKSIIDLGCGDGVITKMLLDRYNPEHIVGVDNSSSMLEKAQLTPTDINWQLSDITDFTGNYDLIFSNAALQWLNNHNVLFKQLVQQTNNTLAIQMPNNFDAPSHVLLRETILENPRFKDKLASTIRTAPVMSKQDYYQLLCDNMSYLDIWETQYLQLLTGNSPILEWVRGTALVPIREKLTADEYTEFEMKYNEKLKQTYKPASNGVTLFPFSRIFIVASR
jgi:trans-aconitate 2-methyltransferase